MALRSLILIFCSLISAIGNAELLHLELGVANNDEALLSENGPGRFRYLEWSIQKRINLFGSKGTIYLNDEHTEGLSLAVIHLRQWLATKKYSDVKVVELPGDYTGIPLPIVKSANLGNPGTLQIPSDSRYFQTPEERIKIIQDLIRISAVSETGLTITTSMKEHMETFQRLISAHGGKLTTQNVVPEQYRWPDGKTYEGHFGIEVTFKAYHVCPFENLGY